VTSEVRLEAVDVDVDVGAGVILDVVNKAFEVLLDVSVELVATVFTVVVASPAIVVLVSENTVAVIVLCVFGMDPDTESQI
jgi:hypothetical protein